MATYNRGGMGNAADDSANEYLSVADLAIKESNELFDKQLQKRLEAVELEYSIRNLYEKLHADLVQQLKELLTKKDSAKTKKEQEKILKLISKLKKKQDEIDKKRKLADEELILKLLDKKRRLLDNDARLKAHTDRISDIEEEINLFGDSFGRTFKLTMAKESERVARMGGFGKAFGDSLANAGKKAMGEALLKLTSGVNDAMNLFLDKASKINTRLLGTSKTFNQMNDVFEKNLGASPFVRYADSIDNLATLVDAGVAYNVELRAFLVTISDKIATTFDAHSASLLKIIRIQQEDSTIYRLGAEAELTKFFNLKFQDTTYMLDVYDDVSLSISDSVILLGTAKGAEYEYSMLKWLGSMYSLGLSSDTITNLASAVNLLATGDILGLSSSGLLNLLVMAANKGNIAFGDLLSLGVNASNVDVLMSNIISYWQEIAGNTNQVVRKSYADLFGLGMSDLVAIRNFNQSDINDLIKNNMSYGSAGSVLQNLLNQVSSRMHVSELINNAYLNVLAGIGTDIASSPGMASTWLINNLIKDATGGINIPFITAMGSGIGLETDLNSLINLGIVGAGTIGQIGNVISSIGNKGGLNMNAWGAEQFTSRGQGLSGVVTGVLLTTSQQAFIGNSSSSDIKDSSLHAAYDNVDTTVAGTEMENADKMLKAILESIDPNIASILEILRLVTTGSAIRVKVEDYGLTFGS